MGSGAVAPREKMHNCDAPWKFARDAVDGGLGPCSCQDIAWIGSTLKRPLIQLLLCDGSPKYRYRRTI